MKKDSNAILVDIRPHDEFLSGHIENAINIPIIDNFPDSILSIASNKSILLYCRSGGKSLKAAKILHNNGCSKIYILGEGIIGWRSVKFGIVSGGN